MGSKSLVLQTLINRTVKSFAEAAEEAPGPSASEGALSSAAVGLFALSLRALRQGHSAPVVDAKTVINRHFTRKVQLKRKAAIEKPEVATVFTSQAARLQQLSKELAEYSRSQLVRVEDAKTARKLIRMFGLPQEAFQEWSSSRRGMKKGSTSPSPIKFRKRKSPEHITPPRRPSRFAPNHGAAGGGSESSPPGSAPQAGAGAPFQQLEPKRLFVGPEPKRQRQLAGGAGAPSLPPAEGLCFSPNAASAQQQQHKQTAASALLPQAPAQPAGRKRRKPAATARSALGDSAADCGGSVAPGSGGMLVEQQGKACAETDMPAELSAPELMAVLQGVQQQEQQQHPQQHPQQHLQQQQQQQQASHGPPPAGGLAAATLLRVQPPPPPSEAGACGLQLSPTSVEHAIQMLCGYSGGGSMGGLDATTGMTVTAGAPQLQQQELQLPFWPPLWLAEQLEAEASLQPGGGSSGSPTAGDADMGEALPWSASEATALLQPLQHHDGLQPPQDLALPALRPCLAPQVASPQGPGGGAARSPRRFGSSINPLGRGYAAGGEDEEEAAFDEDAVDPGRGVVPLKVGGKVMMVDAPLLRLHARRAPRLSSAMATAVAFGELSLDRRDAALVIPIQLSGAC